MIKRFIISKSLKVISDIYPDYNKSKLDEIRYGLESIYLSLTKTIVILFITFILGIFKEAILLLLFFNGIRIVAFGIHASKSWMCWLSSSIIFIGLPYICKFIEFPNIVHYIIIVFSMICFFLYAPADTKKRPLVKKKKRVKFKVFSLIVASIYVVLFFYTDSMFIHNIISTSLLIESVLIHPLTYKLFKLPYKNYEGYVFSK